MAKFTKANGTSLWAINAGESLEEQNPLGGWWE